MATHERFGLFAAVGMVGLSIFGAALSGCAAREAVPVKSSEAPVTNEAASIGNKEEAAASPASDEQLSAATIQAVVREAGKQFQACYEAGLSRDAKLAGRVTVRFVIANSGRVQSAELVETGSDEGSPTDLPDREVLDCMLGAYRMLEFPAFASGEMTVVYPIGFRPEEPAASSATR